jgi:transposase InsO family protein
MQTGSPFERVGIDLTGPWPKSDNNVYIMTYIDQFTKWADAVPLPNKEAVTVATALVSKIFVHVGVPLQILSDQGKEFDNNLMMSLCNKLGIDKVRTSPYHAATNGCIERLHRSINSMLAKCVDENQRNWASLLPHVMAAYRCAVHDSTGYSPNFLHFGREVRAPIDLLMPPQVEDLSVNDFVAKTQQEMHYAYNLAREQLGAQTARRKTYYEMNLKAHKFRPGDWVWYFYPRRRKGRSPKWERMYAGPFLVIEQCSPVNFLIQKSEKADPLVVHMDKLKLVEGSNPPSWLQADQNNIADGDTFSPSTGTNSLDEPCQRSTLRESDAVTSCFGENEHQLGKRITRQPRWMADYAC